MSLHWLTFGIGARAASATQLPRYKSAPGSASEMHALPPAAIDNTLAIGGEDINARVVSTRMTVEVHVNGRGPYRFLVDSGADTSVVGLRIARELQLPVGPPVTLHGMTGSAVVATVRVGALSLGQSTISDRSFLVARSGSGRRGIIFIDAMCISA